MYGSFSFTVITKKVPQLKLNHCYPLSCITYFFLFPNLLKNMLLAWKKDLFCSKSPLNLFAKVKAMHYLSKSSYYKSYFKKYISSHRRCFVRKGVLRNLQNSQENTCARVSLAAGLRQW